ncbi:MAG: cytochrome c oxidase subunit 3 [Acidobacteria bacterium]|nr:cytochrome c oxidase subunit 3 [Acidobacteriota bacterium]
MTRQSVSLPWPHAADTESVQRHDLVQLGVWMFLATVVMLFAAFTSAYIIRRSASDWTPIELPWMLWMSTAALVASSVAFERGRFASKRGQAASARYGISAAAGLGLIFLAGQVVAWRDLVARGVYVPTSPHSSFFFILTATHGVHVVAGLVLLIYTVTRIWDVGVPLDRGAPARLIAASATFWHFLAVLWLYVFVLVSVF